MCKAEQPIVGRHWNRMESMRWASDADIVVAKTLHVGEGEVGDENETETSK